MPKTFSYANTLLVPYTAQQVYAVVDDVAHYHQFLPNCAGSGVTSRTPENNSERSSECASERVLGYMDLSFLGMHYRLDSDNLHTPTTRIDMRLLKGPFKTLTGQWDFKPLGDGVTFSGCKVSFAMQWQYDSAILAMTLGQRFEGIAKQLLDAFIAETARRAA
jgi:ribosome-associated toxin RatA of RatAB toxin-antitoxin module